MTKTEAPAPNPLDRLRAPFPEHQISKLPKPTSAQTDAVKASFKAGIRCKLCGAWHHPDVVHLDYVGHAALTDRLLDTDSEWSWEPMAVLDGLPAFDQTGGLWIRLTVCGVTRLGYGHAKAKQGQDPGAREKEVIGDALRNAAMRFGAALDLWHKGDLHLSEGGASEEPEPPPKALTGQDAPIFIACKAAIDMCANDAASLDRWKADNAPAFAKMTPDELDTVKRYWQHRKKAALEEPMTAPADDGFDAVNGDEIPF